MQIVLAGAVMRRNDPGHVAEKWAPGLGTGRLSGPIISLKKDMAVDWNLYIHVV